jgi:site-specific recombinase XerD
LIYACGLRVGELLAIRVEDIDGGRKQLHIRRSKGHKDRMIPLSDSSLYELRSHYRVYRPKKYLFEGKGRTKDEIVTYRASSVRAIFKRAVKAADIKKNVRLHSLRHSYATHLLEHGINLRYIHVLPGHNSSKTTEIYNHVSRNKLDHLPGPIYFL